MKTRIIAIGNSKGIRIPKVLLDESGIVEDVEIKATKGMLRIVPVAASPPKPAHLAAVLSERVLSRDWDRPEEDRAWADL